MKPTAPPFRPRPTLHLISTPRPQPRSRVRWGATFWIGTWLSVGIVSLWAVLSSWSLRSIAGDIHHESLPTPTLTPETATALAASIRANSQAQANTPPAIEETLTAWFDSTQPVK